MVKLPEDLPQSKSTVRVEALSDGVFAIAGTILVLTIKIPTTADVDKEGLLAVLVLQWPQYITYVISFMTILIVWINHHAMFQRVRHADHSLMFLNGLMLLPVTLVPFPTALLAVFIRHHEARFAAAFFSGVYVLIMGLFILVWEHITRLNRFQQIAEDPHRLRVQTWKYRIGFLFYVLAFGLSFVFPPACIATCCLLAIYFSLPEKKELAVT